MEGRAHSRINLSVPGRLQTAAAIPAAEYGPNIAVLWRNWRVWGSFLARGAFDAPGKYYGDEEAASRLRHGIVPSKVPDLALISHR